MVRSRRMTMTKPTVKSDSTDDEMPDLIDIKKK